MGPEITDTFTRMYIAMYHTGAGVLANEKLSGAGMRRGVCELGFQCRLVTIASTNIPYQKKGTSICPIFIRFKEVCLDSFWEAFKYASISNNGAPDGSPGEFQCSSFFYTLLRQRNPHLHTRPGIGNWCTGGNISYLPLIEEQFDIDPAI